MNKFLKKLLLSCTVLMCMTGCFKRDDLEGVNIYTTVYPVQYVTDFLYGYNSDVSSIYPAETNISEYKLTEKQLKEYADGAIFVYNGLTTEKGIARDLLNRNKDLKIIDVSQGLEYEYNTEELWLNPSDFLMLAHNVKNGLEEYITNRTIIKEIDARYEELKILISSFDAELEVLPSSVDNADIIIASDSLNFLSKYDFSITNIDSTNVEVPNSTINSAKKLITSGTVKYIYMLDNQEETEAIKELVSAGATVKKLRSMTTRTEDDIQNNITYKQMIRSNIDMIKEGLFK